MLIKDKIFVVPVLLYCSTVYCKKDSLQDTLDTQLQDTLDNQLQDSLDTQLSSPKQDQ